MNEGSHIVIITIDDGGASRDICDQRYVEAGLMSNYFGWMNEDCKDQDTKTLAWARTAVVGDWLETRQGWLFCVADSKDIENSGGESE